MKELLLWFARKCTPCDVLVSTIEASFDRVSPECKGLHEMDPGMHSL